MSYIDINEKKAEVVGVVLWMFADERDSLISLSGGIPTEIRDLSFFRIERPPRGWWWRTIFTRQWRGDVAVRWLYLRACWRVMVGDRRVLAEEKK